MFKLLTLWRKFRALRFLMLFALSFLVLLPWFYPWLKNPAKHSQAHQLRVRWAAFLFKFMGISWRVHHEFEPEKGQAYIICANHFSYLDIPTLALTYPGFLRFVAKEELEKIPLFGMFFRTLDLSVSRQNARKASKSMMLAAEYLKKGESIVIFPEGGIKETAPHVSRFKNGAFKLAAETGIPILPVSILGNDYLLGNGDLPEMRRGHTQVVFHPPIFAKDETPETIEKLTQETYLLISQTVLQHANR